MLNKKTLLTASNLNEAFISKKDTASQTLSSNLTISGGQLSLKNSFFSDNSSTDYMRIDPQGNRVIIYDGVNNQRLDVYSSSGSESTYIQTINGTTSVGEIDVSADVNHLKIMNNTGKKVEFGGDIETKVNKRIGYNLSDNTSRHSIYPYRSGVNSLSGGSDAPYDFGIYFESDGMIAIGETDNNQVSGWFDVNDGNFRWKGNINTDSLTLGSQATANGHAVRADRNISTNNGISGGGNLTADRTLSIDQAWLNTYGDGRWFKNTGGTVSGNVTITGTLAMSNTGVSGIASITFNDVSDTSSEGIIFPLTTGTSSLWIDASGIFKQDANKIWHEGNDGAGSGLDADLLDGQQGSSYMRTNTNTSTTGTLTIGTGTTSVLANQSDGSLRVSNASGYIDIAPKNDSYAHIYTDRPTFYFNKELLVNNNKVWNAGNDGAGSGLDADTVDGIQGANLIYGSNATGSNNISDVNDIFKSGFYEGNDVTNAPSTGWYWYMNSAHLSNSSTYKYNGQIAFKNITTANGTPEAYIRSTGGNTTATKWGRLWHDQNDGSGSGLDADLIRGQEPFIDRGYFYSANVTDLNLLDSSGSYRLYKSNVLNAPTSYDWGLLNVFNGGGTQAQMFFTDSHGSDSGLFFRVDYSKDNTWTNWNKVWTDNNDGAGSGLDADKVDGLQASQFLRSDISDSTVGELTVADLKLGTAGEIRATYNGSYILKDFNNGNVTLSAAGASLYLGYSNTSRINLSSDIYAGTSSNLIADTAGNIYYQGTNIDTLYARTAGETYTGSHNFTGATLDWSRDTDRAKIHFVDYGTDSDWLTIDFGDATSDKVRFRNDVAGVHSTILDVGGTEIDSFVTLDLNNNQLKGVSTIYGQYGTIVKSTDEWLRINDDESHASGVYFGQSLVRTDGPLQVGSNGAYFKADSTGIDTAGDITMANHKALYAKNSAGTAIGVLQLSNTNTFYTGSDSYQTILRGSSLRIRPSTIVEGNLTLEGNTNFSMDRGRTEGVAKIYWNASTTANYGIVFQTDNATVLTLGNSSGDSIFNTTVRIDSYPDVTLSGGGALQIGPSTGTNMVFDNNEIQARSNGAGSSLNLNILGGNIVMGNSGSTITANGNLEMPTGSKVIGNNTGNANSSWLGFYESNGTVRKGYVGDGSSTNSDITLASDAGNVVLSAGGATIDVVRNSGAKIKNSSGELKLELINSQTGTAGNIGLELRAEGGGYPYIDFARTTDDYGSRIIYDGSNKLDVRGSHLYINGEPVEVYADTGYYDVTTTGWYTIAYNGVYAGSTAGGDRAMARFSIYDVASSRHDAISFIAGTAFNNPSGMNIKILNFTKFNTGSEVIGGIRIVYGSTYATQYLQVYLTAGMNCKVVMQDNHWTGGWHFPPSGKFEPAIYPAGWNDYKLEIQGGTLNMPKNLFSGTSGPPNQGAGLGDVYIQY